MHSMITRTAGLSRALTTVLLAAGALASQAQTVDVAAAKALANKTSAPRWQAKG